MSTIKVVVKEPQKPAEVREIPNTLEAKQAIVGGWIQGIFVPPLGEEFMLLLNEEGKLIGLPPNLVVPGDILVGSVFIEKVGDEGESVGLTDEEAERAIQFLNGLAI